MAKVKLLSQIVKVIINLLVITSVITFLGCITVKPYELAWDINPKLNKLCSCKTVSCKVKICKEPRDFDPTKWTLLNNEALKKKIEELMDGFNEAIAK